MLILVIFTFCYLLTGLTGQPVDGQLPVEVGMPLLRDCYYAVTHTNFHNCIKHNWRLHEQRINELSRKTEQQRKR